MRIFDFLKKEGVSSKPNAPASKYDIKQVGRQIVINGKSTIEELSGGLMINDLLEHNWDKSPLHFMIEPQVEFHATLLDLDLENGTIEWFSGEWIAGEFIGRTFDDSIFRGSQFTGDFMGEYYGYKSNPGTFKSGTFEDNKSEGLLGIPYLTKIIDKNPSSFHLIQLKKDDSVYIIDENEYVFKLKVTKAICDKYEPIVDSFEIETFSTPTKTVKQKGITTSQSIPIKVKWESIRKNYDKFNIEVGKHLNIPGCLHISKVKSFSFKNPMKGNSLEENIQLFGETICFGQFPSLEIQKDICFDCFAVDDITPLFNIHDSLYSGSFFNELKSIHSLIHAGYITGYGKYKQLKKLFNDTVGVEMDYEKKEVNQVFDFLLKINLLITNARGKENRELLLEKFGMILFSDENETPITKNASSIISDDIDFSKETQLGIDIKLKFAFNSEPEHTEFKKMKQDIVEGRYYLMLMQTQRLLQNGDLVGYHDKLQLKSLFSEQGSPEPPTNEKARNSLNYLSNFKRFVLDTANPPEDAEKLLIAMKLIINDEY